MSSDLNGGLEFLSLVNDGELAQLARFGWRHGATERFVGLKPSSEQGVPVPVAEALLLLGAQGLG